MSPERAQGGGAAEYRKVLRSPSCRFPRRRRLSSGPGTLVMWRCHVFETRQNREKAAAKALSDIQTESFGDVMRRWRARRHGDAWRVIDDAVGEGNGDVGRGPEWPSPSDGEEDGGDIRGVPAREGGGARWGGRGDGGLLEMSSSRLFAFCAVTKLGEL